MGIDNAHQWQAQIPLVRHALGPIAGGGGIEVVPGEAAVILAQAPARAVGARHLRHVIRDHGVDSGQIHI